ARGRPRRPPRRPAPPGAPPPPPPPPGPGPGPPAPPPHIPPPAPRGRGPAPCGGRGGAGRRPGPGRGPRRAPRAAAARGGAARVADQYEGGEHEVHDADPYALPHAQVFWEHRSEDELRREQPEQCECLAHADAAIGQHGHRERRLRRGEEQLLTLQRVEG